MANFSQFQYRNHSCHFHRLLTLTLTRRRCCLWVVWCVGWTPVTSVAWRHRLWVTHYLSWATVLTSVWKYNALHAKPWWTNWACKRWGYTKINTQKEHILLRAGSVWSETWKLVSSSLSLLSPLSLSLPPLSPVSLPSLSFPCLCLWVSSRQRRAHQVEKLSVETARLHYLRINKWKL